MTKDLSCTIPELQLACAGGLRPKAVVAGAQARPQAAVDPGILLNLAGNAAQAAALGRWSGGSWPFLWAPTPPVRAACRSGGTPSLG